MTRRTTPKTAAALGAWQSQRETPEGQEKYCGGCYCWWPADTEFFSSDAGSRDGLFYRCKACYRDLPGQRKRSRSSANEPAPVALASVPWLGTQLFTSLIERSAS